MIVIDIKSLRDPATREALRTQLRESCAILEGYDLGVSDARESLTYRESVSTVSGLMAPQSVLDAYDAGWDSVRLSR